MRILINKDFNSIIMGELATSERMITLFYDPESTGAKKTLAYAKAEGVAVQEVDITKTPLTGTQIAEIAEKLNLTIGEMVDVDHPRLKGPDASDEFSEEDWITIIRKNPQVLRQPIAIRGKRGILVKTPSDIIRI